MERRQKGRAPLPCADETIQNVDCTAFENNGGAQGTARPTFVRLGKKPQNYHDTSWRVFRVKRISAFSTVPQFHRSIIPFRLVKALPHTAGRNRERRF